MELSSSRIDYLCTKRVFYQAIVVPSEDLFSACGSLQMNFTFETSGCQSDEFWAHLLLQRQRHGEGVETFNLDASVPLDLIQNDKVDETSSWLQNSNCQPLHLTDAQDQSLFQYSSCTGSITVSGRLWLLRSRKQPNCLLSIDEDDSCNTLDFGSHMDLCY